MKPIFNLKFFCIIIPFHYKVCQIREARTAKKQNLDIFPKSNKNHRRSKPRTGEKAPPTPTLATDRLAEFDFDRPKQVL